MMCVDSAAGAEEVLCCAGMEAVACQRILALQDLDAAHFRHDDNGASHPAERTRAAEDRIEAVAQRGLKTHRAAMAPASPNVCIVHHVACVSCSDDFYAYALFPVRNAF